MMDGELLTAVISRWLHVGTAIVLVGGTTFLRYVVHPVLHPAHPELLLSIRDRWKRFVHAGIALFLISGFYNYFRAMPLHKGDGLYHGLVGTKILLALFVFFLASALTGRSAGTQKFRDQAPKWAAVLVLVSFVIVAISGFVKVRPLPAAAVVPAAAGQAVDAAASGAAATSAPAPENPAGTAGAAGN